MAAKIVITVGYGELITGLWCPHCKLPSGIEQQVYWLKSDGVSPLALIRKCYDCDAPLERDA